jgi:hypothetical protein
MSRRSILLATSMCIVLAQIAAIAPASAFGCYMFDPTPPEGLNFTCVWPGNIVSKPAIPLWAFPAKGHPEVGPRANVSKPAIAMQGFRSAGWHRGR